MNFKVGSLVTVIDASSAEAVLSWVRAGMIGEIIGDPHRQESTTFGVCNFWPVRIRDTGMWICEYKLRLIPGDSAGRQVVDWNWRTLVTPETASA